MANDTSIEEVTHRLALPLPPVLASLDLMICSNNWILIEAVPFENNFSKPRKYLILSKGVLSKISVISPPPQKEEPACL